jgi:YcaO-like protein with predicted kinase domain
VIDSCSDENGLKRFRGGSTHRIIDPEATLHRVMPLASRMGITRVAMLTGLDTIGIPVAAAFRPNSRSVAVHQGKGMTIAAAKASAIMEAVETFHAERLRLPLRLASYEELIADTNAADPQCLPRACDAPEPDRCFWVEGEELVSGEPLWVPFELVSADYRRAQPADLGLFQATTNGLGSGNCALEAMLHGLYEVVERDAIALWRAVPAARSQRAVDLDTVDGPACSDLLERFRRASVPVRVWDVTSDVGLPTFVCLAMASDPTQGVEPELGSGCHADRDVALARALTEAAQARVTRISGARDDFIPASYDATDRQQRWEAAWSLFEGPAGRDFRLAPDLAGETLRCDLDAALHGLARAGMSQVVWIDLSCEELGIPTGRIVVPCLEGPWTPEGGDYRRGARAQQAAGRR